MLDEDEAAHIERLLKIYQRNLQTLDNQAASYGGEHLAPLAVQNQIIDTREKIAELRAKLAPAGAAPANQRQPERATADPRSRDAAVSSPSAPAATPITLDFQTRPEGALITWRHDMIGREESLFTAPYDNVELPLVIRALDVVQYPEYPQHNGRAEQLHFTFSAHQQELLTALGLWKDQRVVANAYQVVGAAIYNALGPAGQGVLKAVRNAGIAQRLTTNYVLRFPQNAISLAALPWEALWDRDKNQAILIRGNTIDSCERYVDIDMAIPPPLPSGQQLRLLALSPYSGIPEDIREKERTARRKTWDKLKAAGTIDYDEIAPLTMTALNDYLLDAPARPDVIHYFGHGIYKNGKGYLQFDNEDGERDLVSAERLAAVLGDVRLIVIHACQSAMVDDAGGLLTGVAPALSIVSGAVVAMQLTVAIPAATRFSQVFYDQLLGKQRSLQEAVARGRQILFTEAADGASWYVPTLYIRGRDQQSIHLIQ
jgi:hypothetical protein